MKYEFKNIIPPPLQVLVGIACLIILLSAVMAMRSIISPLLISLLLVIIFAPLIEKFSRIGLPHWLSILFTLLIIVLVLFMTVSMLVNGLQAFLGDLPNLVQKLQDRIGFGMNALADSRLANMGFSFDVFDFSGALGANQLVAVIGSGLEGLVKVFSNMILIAILVLFMLLEIGQFRIKIHNLPLQGAALHTNLLVSQIQKYLIYKASFSVLTGFLIGTFLWLYGFEYALVLGFIALLLNFIPTIGSIAAAIPAVLLGLVNHTFADTAIIAGWYVVVNMIIGNFFEPRILGKEMGLSPLVVFLSLVLWGWVLGPVGMFLAVPLSMAIKLILDSFSRTKWLAIMMG